MNRKAVEQAQVTIPSLVEQNTIAETQKKLKILKNSIDGFYSELALNPTNSGSILGQLDKMLATINSLTDADIFRGIVREGESKYVEFKETLSLDIKKKTKEKYIEESALKTVVAFLNTDGGKLLIGVSDDGQIPGLNLEISKFHKSMDRFLLPLEKRVKERIGEEYYPFIEHKIIEVDNKHVLYVECAPSPSPCYLDGNDFYVRTNPATDKLEGPNWSNT